MTWVATAVGLITAAVGAYQTNQVAKKQDNVAAAGIRGQAENQRRINQRVNKTLDDTEKSNPNEARKTANDSYIGQVQRMLAHGTAGLARKGVSQQYDEMAGEGATQAGDFAGNIAGLLSRIDAGSMQRQNESNMLGNMGFDLAPEASNIGADEFLTAMKMKNVQRSPYLDAAIGAGKAYAANSGGSGGTWGWGGV